MTDVSEIKEEVVYTADLKVKEENTSSVVYDVKVTSKVDIKLKKENPPQRTPTAVTNERVQSPIDINLYPDHDLFCDELESEQESKNIIRENSSEIDSEIGSIREHPQQIQKTHSLQCSSCPQFFSNIGLLITHARTKHAEIKKPSSDPISDDEDETLSVCPLCSKSFTTFEGLKSHFLRFHIKNKAFQCPICLESKNEVKKFSTKAILKRHIALVHDPARWKFQCDICPQKFISRPHYKTHKQIHIAKKHKCEYCSNAYRHKVTLLRHIIAVHKEYTDRHETFKCDECEQLFCSQKDLEYHVLQTHEADTVQCKICFKKFREEGELRKHLEVSHWENRTWLVCDVCSQVFKNNQKLVEHLEVEHKRFFKCRKCFRSFGSKEEYESHSTEILDRSQFQCKVCLVFLNTECSFTTHKDTHLKTDEMGNKNVLQLYPGVVQECSLKCDFCPMKFRRKSSVIEHAKGCHPNEKWKCKSCEKSFQLKYQLSKHELLHSANKPFKCKVCPKSFTLRSHLKRHEEVHKKQKRFPCTQCKKSFPEYSSLRQHIGNNHGGDKPFKCDICKKAFVSKSSLVEHSVVHAESRFSCSKCSYSYKCARGLKRHQQRMHSENTLNNEYERLASHPVRSGRYSKYFEDLVYVCSVEECAFETKDAKEVAIHNSMHGLPLLILSREYGCLLDKNLASSTSKSGEIIKKHTVQPRFKCKHCSKMFSRPSGNIKKHEMECHSGTKKKKHGRQSKYVQNVVFACSAKECDFETKDEKKVVIHYAKHDLPRVNVPRLLHGPSSQVFVSKALPMNISKHMIKAQYKCLQCFITLTSSGGLRKHTRRVHCGKKTKQKKRRVRVSSSDEDEM